MLAVLRVPAKAVPGHVTRRAGNTARHGTAEISLNCGGRGRLVWAGDGVACKPRLHLAGARQHRHEEGAMMGTLHPRTWL